MLEHALMNSGEALDRKLYLQKIWEKYPSAPKESGWVLGRFERRAESFDLLSEFSRQSFKVADIWRALYCREEVTVPVFLGCLRTGDWVAYHPENRELGLLAPKLEDSPVGALTSEIRAFESFKFELQKIFRESGFQAVSTPSLVPSPGTEVFLDLFVTRFKNASDIRDFYLPTSPELHLKKALAAGAEKIFELRPVFRNAEISQKHQPEFHMLEWYRAFRDLEAIKDDCRWLLRAMSGNADLQFACVSVTELFQQLGLTLTPSTTQEELKNWCCRLGVHFADDDLWDDLFYRIFVDRIEPYLPSSQPLFVEKYPASQAALARVGADGWAERFELYWRGFELANAYHELNDPDEQLLRSQKDNETRKVLGRPEVALDAEFFAALRAGLPPSAGIALGVERLFMAIHSVKDIAQTRAFPMKPSL